MNDASRRSESEIRGRFSCREQGEFFDAREEGCSRVPYRSASVYLETRSVCSTDLLHEVVMLSAVLSGLI